jgi:phosphoribosylformylglycinamidine synthase I
METRPRIAVIVFPGSNDDRDAAWALGALGAEAALVWHGQRELPARTTAIVLPGGFSYGDYLRAGAIARFAPAMEAVTRFAGEGGLVLGICNGFQILCEAGLLPGVLRMNKSLSFICRDVTLRVERVDTPFTHRCEPGQRLRIPIKNMQGCWYGDDELVAKLDQRGQIVLRYHGDNPSGAVMNVAGVVNSAGNVLGMMPHPEHAVDPLLGSPDGSLILASLVESARERLPLAITAQPRRGAGTGRRNDAIR